MNRLSLTMIIESFFITFHLFLQFQVLKLQSWRYPRSIESLIILSQQMGQSITVPNHPRYEKAFLKSHSNHKTKSSRSSLDQEAPSVNQPIQHPISNQISPNKLMQPRQTVSKLFSLKIKSEMIIQEDYAHQQEGHYSPIFKEIIQEEQDYGLKQWKNSKEQINEQAQKIQSPHDISISFSKAKNQISNPFQEETLVANEKFSRILEDQQGSCLENKILRPTDFSQQLKQLISSNQIRLSKQKNHLKFTQNQQQNAEEDKAKAFKMEQTQIESKKLFDDYQYNNSLQANINRRTLSKKIKILNKKKSNHSIIRQIQKISIPKDHPIIKNMVQPQSKILIFSGSDTYFTRDISLNKIKRKFNNCNRTQHIQCQSILSLRQNRKYFNSKSKQQKKANIHKSIQEEYELFEKFSHTKNRLSSQKSSVRIIDSNNTKESNTKISQRASLKYKIPFHKTQYLMKAKSINNIRRHQAREKKMCKSLQYKQFQSRKLIIF